MPTDYDFSNCTVRLVNRVTGEVLCEFESIKADTVSKNLTVFTEDAIRNAFRIPEGILGRDHRIGVSGTPCVPDMGYYTDDDLEILEQEFYDVADRNSKALEDPGFWADSPYASYEEAFALLKEK